MSGSILRRREFLLTGLGATIASLLRSHSRAQTQEAAAPLPDRPAGRGASRAPRVCEARSLELRGSIASGAGEGALSYLLLEALAPLIGQQLPPLDALTELFPDDPPVAVIVHGREAGPYTPLLASRFAESLVNMGSEPGGVAVIDAADADLVAGGYRIVREGTGPLCRGTEPDSGYAPAGVVPGASAGASLSRLVAGDRTRLGVVGRLSGSSGVMGPFVLDAALRAASAETRERARRDPAFGARLLAGPAFGGRIGLVIGDLVQIPFGGPVPGGGAAKAGPGGDSWAAGELLLGDNLFATERVGHRILSNLLEGRGRKAPPPHPLLTAAESLGIPGAALKSLDWRKISL